jgi:protein-tyrosine phosphatase
MSFFFDLHCHMLCNVDDGASSPEEMYAMLEMAYADGTRALCLTPHYSPYHYGDTFDRSSRSFEILSEYARGRYPDLQLFMGHELGYYHGCEEALRMGRCRMLGSSRYVLVDFPAQVDFFELSAAMHRLRSMGYLTVLAHAERYRCLSHHLDWVREYVEAGGLIQINASGICERWGSKTRALWIRLVRENLVHFISSDGHNLSTRRPKISVCIKYLQKHYHPDYIRDLTWENAWHIMRNGIF